MKSSRTFCFVFLTFVLASCGAPPSTPLSAIPPATATPSPAVLNTPSAVATGQTKTWGVVVDDANIYWTDCGTNPTAQDGKVVMQSKSGGTSTVLVSQEACPSNIAVDATNVYYLASDKTSTKKLMRVSKAGGKPITLVSGQDIRSIAADANGVYWTTCDPSKNTGAAIKLSNQDSTPIAIDSGKGCFFDVAVDASGIYWIDDRGIMRGSSPGGASISLTPSRFHPRNLIIDENNLYWIADSYILRLAKSGGEPNVLVASENGAQAIAVDASYLYWTDGNAVMRIANMGGTQYTLATVNGSASSLAIDNTNIYWTNYGDTLMRVAKSGGVAVTKSQTEPQTIVFAQEGPNSLAVDDASVYWATCRYEKEKYNRGAVMKAPKAGGDAVALATNQACPGNLVLDASNVYWVNQGAETSPNDYQDGAVLKVAKSGGAPIALATKQDGRASLAVDDANVYWTSCGFDRGVFKVAKDGGGGVTQVIAEKDCPSSIAVDASSIYWISGDAIQKMDKRGGAAQAIATSSGSALTVDNSSVYWTRTEQTSRSGLRSCADERSALMETSKDGGAQTTIATIPGYAPGKITVDESNVYYGTDCTQGILRVSKSGGTPSVVIPNQVAAQIAIDASNIFWSVYTNGVILKMTRPK